MADKFELPPGKAPRVGAAMILVIHLALIGLLVGQTIAGNAGWLTVVALPLNIFCAWYRMWQLDWLTQVARFRRQEAEKPPPPIDHRLFMPYSTCPKCDTEALHWIAPDQTASERGVHRQEHDLFRECRECGHVWSQKVGAP